MPKRSPHLPTLISTFPLLITESQDEFDRVHDALDQEIKPRGIIEQIYVADIAYLTWETWRLRRCKAAIINSAFREPLEELLERVLREPNGYRHQVSGDAQRLAQGWFTDAKVKKQVAELLGEFQLDESAVEAAAIKASAADVEQLDKLLASSESRRNKALRCIVEYRGDFAKNIRDGSDRIIEGKVIPLRGNKTPLVPT